jgi:hypothetical protein
MQFKCYNCTSTVCTLQHKESCRHHVLFILLARSSNWFQPPLHLCRTRTKQWTKCQQKQSKAVPLHAMVALGGRGGTAPTHSWPRHWMGVSGQRHALAALCDGERTPGTHCTGGWVGLRAGLDTEIKGKILCPSGDRTSIARSFRP